MAQEFNIEWNDVSITPGNKKVIKKTLIVSLLFHLVIRIDGFAVVCFGGL